VFLVVSAVVVPMTVTATSLMTTLSFWLLYAIAAVGFYLIFGIAGRFAFSQTFMVSLGAYTAAFVSERTDLYLVTLVAVAVVAALVAVVIGYLGRHLRHLYFGIMTLGAAAIGTQVFKQWEWFSGPQGTKLGIARPTLFGFEPTTPDQYFWLFLAGLGLVLLLVVLVEQSPARRDLVAARDQPVVAETLGIPVVRIQLAVFVVGSVMAALAGGLYANWQGFVATDSFGVDLSIGIFVMVILGGTGSMWGPIVGAAFYVLLPEVLSSLEQYKTILFSVILLLVVIAMPQGLVGMVGQVRHRTRRRTSSPLLAGEVEGTAVDASAEVPG
jgi:branched-chain amino acid transport system permease protein